jgi:hypothetical protein
MHIQRRLNYTGRKRINKTDVKIQLVNDGSRAASFLASVDLSRLNLPSDAPVFIEARQKDLMQRFECGTVGDFKLPQETTLSEVDGSAPVSFWVRVLDPSRTDGRLLAVARSIHPEGDVPGEDEGRDSLLAVKARPLGNIPWTIEFPTDEEGIPWLVINSRIPDPIGKVHGNAIVQGYVLPAAVREIFGRIYMDAEIVGEGTWQDKWLQYGKRLIGQEWPQPHSSATEESIEWIDQVTEMFCEQFHLAERLVEHEQKEQK